MMIDSLPCVKATVYDYNPNFIAGSTDLAHQLFVPTERLVEVLTLNLNSGTMRIRYQSVDHTGKKEMRTENISIDGFYKEYDIVSIG